MKEFKPQILPEGKFVAVWEYNGNVWAKNFKREGENLFAYDDEVEDFADEHDAGYFELLTDNERITNIRFFTI